MKGYIQPILIALLFVSLARDGGDLVTDDTSVLPVPGAGLHLLIVEETEDRVRLPEAQRQVLFSPDLRQWLKNKGYAYRIWDRNVDASHEPSGWFKQALEVKRESLPWLVASNGKTGFSGPLPVSVDETKKIVEGLK